MASFSRVAGLDFEGVMKKAKGYMSLKIRQISRQSNWSANSQSDKPITG